MPEEASSESTERELQRAGAARERATEGRRGAARMDAERHAPSVWNEAVGKSAEGEAALSRQQYAKASEAFAAALALYHQAQAQARESDRRDATTVPAGSTPSGASGVPSGGLVAGEATRLRGRIISAPEVVGKTPARPRRLMARVVTVGVGGLAVILITVFYWRPQPPPAPTPTQQSTPAQPTAAPPGARPAEAPAGRDEAAQLRSQMVSAREEAAKADAEHLAATQFAGAEEKSSAAEAALSQRDMAAAQARYREAIEAYGLAKTEANRVAALARREAPARTAEGQAQEVARAPADGAATADRARPAARERAPVARPTPPAPANRPGAQKPEPLRIRASVEEKLRAARLLRNPDSDEPGVAVESVGVDGNVQLVGVLREEADRQAVTQLARTVEGVTAVDVRRVNVQKGWKSQ